MRAAHHYADHDLVALAEDVVDGDVRVGERGDDAGEQPATLALPVIVPTVPPYHCMSGVRKLAASPPLWSLMTSRPSASNSADTPYSADRSRPDTTPAKASRHHPDHGPGLQGLAGG